jgi:isocitrate dehydrogenase
LPISLAWACVETVQAGDMTKDLASLIGREQKYFKIMYFMPKIDSNLQKEME